MARKCPDCGHFNDDELIFCEECGEPVDPKTRLMMELEGTKSSTSRSGAGRTASSSGDDAVRGGGRRDDDDDDYVPSYHVEEEKKSPVGLIIGLAVVAAVVWFLFFR